MGGVWVSLISALGASGLAGALVAWWKDRYKDDATVTKILREMSKEAVEDARNDLKEMRAEMRELMAVTKEMKAVLGELVDLMEQDVFLSAVADHPLTASQLHELALRARTLV